MRVALELHWAASDANDFKAEHEIYREDAVLDYPQWDAMLHGSEAEAKRNRGIDRVAIEVTVRQSTIDL